MAKREITLVIIMALVLAYGAYEIFFSGGKAASPRGAPPAEANVDLNAFVTDMAKNLRKSPEQEKVQQIAKTATLEWAPDPFWDQDYALQTFLHKEEAAGSESAEDLGLMYSGFVELGDTRLAIIDDFEYQKGEWIDPGDYRLEEIHRTSVVLVRKTDGQRFVLQLEE
ncbi:conserved hypothetical protein [uncultured Desulfatiglans sp.]|nr:conserved hypothetical protein [uncultured Desulfatiglans sp.]